MPCVILARGKLLFAASKPFGYPERSSDLFCQIYSRNGNISAKLWGVVVQGNILSSQNDLAVKNLRLGLPVIGRELCILRGICSVTQLCLQ